MKVEDLQDALKDFPPDSEVFAESEMDYFAPDLVQLDESGDVVLTEEKLNRWR